MHTESSAPLSETDIEHVPATPQKKPDVPHTKSFLLHEESCAPLSVTDIEHNRLLDRAITEAEKNWMSAKAFAEKVEVESAVRLVRVCVCCVCVCVFVCVYMCVYVCV